MPKPCITRRALLTVASLSPLCNLAAASSAESNGPYALPDTAVHDVPDPKTGRKYQLWVDVPKSYAGRSSSVKFPVVFLTDAPYAFPLVRSIRSRVGQGGQNIEDFVLVGLAPAVGEVSATSRLRDYSPSNPLLRPQRKTDHYGGPAYGKAEHYREYLENVAIPALQSAYRIDMKRSTYIGHSYGGLFGAYALLSSPTLFSRYALSSPSLWFDQRVMFELEAAYAKSHRDLPAQLMMYCGSYETIRPEPRFYKDDDMVRDMKDFEHILKGRKYPSLKVGSQVVSDEDHFTVFPSVATRALLWALPGKGPYTSG